MSATLSNILHNVVPQWGTVQPKDPAGNYLCMGLKTIHEDSKNLFPPSEYNMEVAAPKAERWKSLYGSDFVTLAEMRAKNAKKRKAKTARAGYSTYGNDYAPMEDRDSVRCYQANQKYRPYKPKSAPLPKNNEEQGTKMFMNWKIPDRVTEAGSPTLEKYKTNFDSRSHVSPPPKIPSPGSALYRSQSRAKSTKFPNIQSSRSVQEVQSARSYQDNHRAAPGYRASLQGTPLPNSARAPDMIPPSRHKQTLDRRAKSFRTQEVLKNFQPDQRQAVEKFLRNNNIGDPKKVEKIYQLLNKSDTNTEDSYTSVHKWMKTANDNDRKLAVDFFQSITGTQLLGNITKEQLEKITKVTDLLQTYKPLGKMYLRSGAAPEKPPTDGSLRYVRLLTPKTRANSWMHQTWHHLPPYKDDNPVNNRSAIYTEPHAMIDRHYTIHPDWGI